MFVKSKKSAILMACFFVGPAVVIAFLVGQLQSVNTPPAEQNLNMAGGFAGFGPVVIAIVILLLSIGLASLVIYRLNEFHYGLHEAIRWTMAGIIYGLLQQVVLTRVPADFDFRISSVVKQIGGDLLWKVLTLVFSYLIVFPFFSLFQYWRCSWHKA